MARRRLNTILATTTLAAGLSVAPAWGQSLGDVTEAVQTTVEDTTETVDDTTESVEDTVEETTETVEDTTGDSDGGDGTEDTEGTDDAPLDADLEVDVAPEDEDGSPQLEVDGGATLGDQTVDVGSVTDPIEDAVDPDDPAPGTDGTGGSDDNKTGTSSDSRDSDGGSWASTGSGGFLAGGGVTAAGGNTRPAGAPGSDSNGGGGDQSGRAVGEYFAAFAAGNRGSDWSRGAANGPGSTTNSSDIAPPQVAGPADPSFEQFPASQVEEPAVLATPASVGDPTSPMAGVLKSLAALMVLGTGLAYKRTLDQA